MYTNYIVYTQISSHFLVIPNPIWWPQIYQISLHSDGGAVAALSYCRNSKYRDAHRASCCCICCIFASFQLQCHILTLEFAVDVFAAALTHVTSPSPPIKMSGPLSPPSRRHRWLIVALYFWSDAWTIG